MTPLVATLPLLIVLVSCATTGAEPTRAEPTGPVPPAGSAPAAGEVAAPDVTVRILRSRFETLEVRIAPGATVTFRNDDPYAHTVTSGDDSPIAFDSGELSQDETFSIRFDEPGEYPYFCRIHPTMRAVVIVG